MQACSNLSFQESLKKKIPSENFIFLMQHFFWLLFLCIPPYQIFRKNLVKQINKKLWPSQGFFYSDTYSGVPLQLEH